MNYKTTILTACSLLIAGCGDSQPNSTADVDYAAEAQRIADSSIIVDTHIDVPMRVHAKPQDVSRATDSGDFDYPRAVAWNMAASAKSRCKVTDAALLKVQDTTIRRPMATPTKTMNETKSNRSIFAMRPVMS